MAENGIIITQSGIPVERSSDYQRVLDSRWRFMEIEFDNQIDISYDKWTVGYNFIQVYRHGLGFLPAFEFFQEPNSMGNPDVIFGDTIYSSMIADTQYVYVRVIWDSGDLTVPLRIKGQLRVFNLPITEEYTAPAQDINVGTAITDTSIGVKALDPSRGAARMDDESIESYTVNTRAKAISVHKTGMEYATDHTLVITHNVGYEPTFYVCRVEDQASGFYANPLNGVRTVRMITNQFNKATANGKTITFSGAQASIKDVRLAYVILKDPVEIAA